MLNKQISKLKNLPTILWINIDQSKDRYEYMLSQFKKFNIKNHKRIRGLSYIDIDINDDYLNREDGIKLAVKSSHLSAIKYFVDNYKDIGDICIISEDDLSFDYVKYWGYSFDEYISKIPNFDVVQLSFHTDINHLFKIFNQFQNKIYKRHTDLWSSNCYLITYEYAKRIIEKYNFTTDINYYNDNKKIDKEYLINNKLDVIDNRFIYNDNTYTIPLFTYNIYFKSVSINDNKKHEKNKKIIEQLFWNGRFLPKVLWINMDKSHNRKNKMEEYFNQLNIDNKRIVGLDGDKSGIKEHNIPNIEMVYEKRMIGCTVSHLNAIKYYVDNYDEIGDTCIIMEDDISVVSSISMWRDTFENYLSIFGNVEWDIIQLQIFFKDIKNDVYNVDSFFDNFNINKPFKRTDNLWGTGCYIINYKYARKVLSKYNFTTVDEYVNRFNDEKYFMDMYNKKLIHPDHKVLYNENTYTLPLFYLNEYNDTNIGDKDYNNLQRIVNSMIINKMVDIFKYN